MRWKIYLLLTIGIILIALPFLIASQEGAQVCGGGCSSGGCAYLSCNGGTSQTSFFGGGSAPIITIVNPQSIYYKTQTGIPLDYTYTIGGGAVFSQTWYNVQNSSGDITTANTTLNGLNTTISVPRDGTYNVTVYVNQSTGQTASATINFGVASSINIQLNSPSNYQWFNSTNNINISANIYDVHTMSLCTLYKASSLTAYPPRSSMTSYYNFFPPLTNNGTIYETFNLSEGYYVWNMWCMDSTGLNNFALNPWYFGIDPTAPTFSNIAITSTAGTQTQSFSFNASDIALQKCWYSITNSTGGEDPLNPVNKSVSCNSANNIFTVQNYGNYNLLLYANNSAGLTATKTTAFTVSPTPPAPPSGGGGGGTGPSITYPTVGLAQPKNVTLVYSNLDKSIIFSAFNNYCAKRVKALSVINYYTGCYLNYQDLAAIQQQLKGSGVDISTSDMNFWYQQYKQNVIYQTFSTKEQVSQYDLTQALIKNPLTVNPPSISTSILVPSDKILRYTLQASKTISKCDVTSQQFIVLSNGTKINPLSCVIITNTTAQVRYLTSPGFRQIYTGQVAIISGSGETQETVYVNVQFTAYWLQYPILGMPIWVFLIFGTLGLAAIIYGIVSVIRNKTKKRKK